MPRVSDSIETEDDYANTTSDFLNQFNPYSFRGTKPTDVGVPHPTWRPNQLEALDAVGKYVFGGKAGAIFVELPTGSGKSAIPTALASNQPVLVIVESHSLLDQYHDEYGFKVVKGMASYPCIHDEKVIIYKERYNRPPNASECHFQDMSICPVYDRCPYIVAREEALASERMACTYAFGMLSMKVRQRKGIGCWDEAHLSANIITDLSEISITQSFLTNFSLPNIPLSYRAGLLTSIERTKLRNWLSDCEKRLSKPPQNIFFEESAEWVAAFERVHKLALFLTKVEQVFINFDKDGYKYSYRVGTRTIEKTSPKLIIKPLTAAINANRLIGVRHNTILMSATIGEPAPLAIELGFKDYEYLSYPHPIPKEYRPIYDLCFERMTWDNMKKMPMLFNLQAVRIAAFIQSLPEDWRGVILTSSYAKKQKLLEGLKASKVGKRIFDFQPGSVTGRVNEFMNDKTKGAIAVDISYAWGHGVSFAWDKARFMVVASVPFGEFNDPFQIVRRQNTPNGDNFAWWHSYTAVPQMCGRVSRGEVQEDGTPLLNVGLLADGSATTRAALSYYPAWFKESIVPWRPL